MSPHEQYILDQMLVEARAMMMEGSPLELDPSQFSDCVTSLIWRLRKAEKDAARYRFIRDESTDYHIGEFFSTEVNDRDDCIDSLIEQLNLRMNRLKAKAIIK